MEDFETFLKESPIAEKIKLEPNIIVGRTQLSPGELAVIKQRGYYGEVPEKELTCEIEAGGQILAEGKIIRKQGEYYFKVTDMNVEDAK